MDSDYFGDHVNDGSMMISEEEEEVNHLSPEDLKEISEYHEQYVVQGRPEDWVDRFISSEDERYSFNIDESLDNSWKICKEEFHQVKSRICEITKMENGTEVTFENNVDITPFGEHSNFYQTFCNQHVEFDRKQLLHFMCTFCIQYAHRMSTDQGFSIIVPK